MTHIKPNGWLSLSDWLAMSHSSLKDRLALVMRLVSQVEVLHRSSQIHRAIHIDLVRINRRLQPQLPPMPDVRWFGGDDWDPEFCPPELSGGMGVELPSPIDVAADALREAGYSINPRRIDVYQLGTVLCQVTTGQPVRAYIYDATVKARFPAVVRPLLERSLGVESLERFQDCEQLLEELDRALERI